MEISDYFMNDYTSGTIIEKVAPSASIKSDPAMATKYGIMNSRILLSFSLTL